jgi:hypothetical protein
MEPINPYVDQEVEKKRDRVQIPADRCYVTNMMMVLFIKYLRIHAGPTQ